jgi:hypothetical protein
LGRGGGGGSGGFFISKFAEENFYIIAYNTLQIKKLGGKIPSSKEDSGYKKGKRSRPRPNIRLLNSFSVHAEAIFATL